jgi:hypothetical protein
MIRALLRRIGFGSRTPSMPFTPAAGQLVSVETDDGQYGVMKILAADRDGVHARLYVQRFPVRPSSGSLGDLSLAAFGPEHENPFSIGHMPLSYTSFAGWRPELIGHEAVREEELDGYRMWEEAEGGYF